MKKNITYVFAGDRKEKFLKSNFQSKDFFYGLNFFDTEDYNLEIIEPKQSDSLFIGKLLGLVDSVFKKVINLPVYTREFVNFKNIRILLNSDKIIFVNETTFCSLAPLLLFLKIFKNLEVYVFVMGLYSKKLRFPKLKYIHYFIIRIFNHTAKQILFLGQGEYDKAISVHNSLESKFKEFPFYVDFEFWKVNQNIDLNFRKEILFVGNDGNRDYDLLIKIVKKMKDYKFVAVTQNQNIIDSDLPNLNVLNKGNNILTDKDLKKIYSQSRFIILPLKNSYQPSGQSVSLQSMASKRAVLISHTDGFWDKDQFADNKEIKFIYKNNIENWVSTIEEIYNDEKLLKSLELNGYNIVKNELNLEIFKTKLLNLLNL